MFENMKYPKECRLDSAERCAEWETEPQVPDAFFDQVKFLWKEFKAGPGDWRRFDHLDIALRVFAAKWSAYSTARRIEACKGSDE